MCYDILSNYKGETIMSTVVGVVQNVTSRPVQTKWGQKSVWDVHLDDGNVYKNGFKNPPVVPGDTVTITYEVGKYGNDIKSLSKGSVGASSPAPTEVSGPVNKVTSYPIKNSKPFPVPFDSGERAIIRQNSLTNARELVCTMLQKKSVGEDWLLKDDKQWDNSVDLILRIAYKFEEYSSGDREAKAVDAILDKNKTTKAKKTPPKSEDGEPGA